MKRLNQKLSLLFCCALLGGCGYEFCIGPFGDCYNQPSETTSTTTGALTLTTEFPTVVPGGTATFVATGGFPPYTFSITSGEGSIDASTGELTAPAGVNEVVVVQVRDSKNNIAVASIVTSN